MDRLREPVRNTRRTQRRRVDAGVLGVPVRDELTPAHDRVLTETDTPFLAPVPYRGRENEPAYVIKVAELLATLWEISLKEVASITSANFEKAFGVTLRG